MTDPRVSVAIMAHQKRAAFIPELEAALDRPATVVWDEHNDRWHTGRRALLAYDPNATHHLVVQDDAVIPRDLVTGLEAALAHAPRDVPVCLYVGKVRPYAEMVTEYVARAQDVSWLVMDRLNWGVAVAIPTTMIDDLVAYCDTLSIPNYDTRMSKWFEANNIPVWYPWPSLVDHRESPSLVPGRGHSGRVAHRFVGASVSALDIDYSGAVLRLPNANDYRPGGPTTMLFKSTEYDNLSIPTIGVKFKDGYAEATTRGAISYLQQPHMKRRGVRPATDEEIASRHGKDVTEPAPVEAPSETIEIAEPDPVVAPAKTVPVEEEAPAVALTVDDVPDGVIADVQEWVNEDADRARIAIEAERLRDKPRATLIGTLELVISAAEAGH